MKIEVHIKDSVYTLSCGNGSQKLRWLAEAAALKYDPNSMLKVGEPRCIKLQDGTVLNFNDRISDRLYDNVRVWVLFQDFTPSLVGDKKKDTTVKKIGKK